jgi:hypothetical protein
VSHSSFSSNRGRERWSEVNRIAGGEARRVEWCRGEGSTEGKEEESEKVREGGGSEGSDKPEEVAG